MPTFKPEVNEASEFLEISSDFSDPREIIREAISNSFDAKATEIHISAVIDKSVGEDELVITISDNGEGMGEEELRYFFGLGFTNRVKLDELGKKITEAIGEKGHGTKIYFNCRCIEVETIKDAKLITAFLAEPKKNLRLGKLPKVEYKVTPAESPRGMKVIIRGYNDNNQAGFSHEELRDHIYWFTRFGSFEKEIGIKKYEDVVIHLSGLGWEEEEGEPLEFGHPFPVVKTDIRELKSSDKVSPLDYYVAGWPFPKEPLIGIPGAHIDFVFYLEGDKAKREYNKMIHEPRTGWRPGQYDVHSRYGLWLCKDYIPIERRNFWVSEKTEWTKYHAFVNCQEFHLTANRGDLGNTPPRILEAIEKTVKEIFERRIKPSKEFEKYQEELGKEQLYQSAQKEEKDFQRRKRLTLQKKTAKLKSIELLEPRQESGVFSLVLQLLVLEPSLFDFKVIDYDTSIGYDLLVTKDYALDLNKAAMRFAEIKYELKRDFNHSFKKLAAVICWDTKLSNDDEVTDLTGAKRIMKITPGDNKAKNSYTKYMLVSSTEPHNIEVLVLKDFLRECLKIELRPRSNE
ncbi:hypothetical protein ES702_05075 [subsurface metagenome]